MSFRITQNQEIIPLGSRSGAGITNAYKFQEYIEGLAFIKVTAITATKMVMTLQTSPNKTDWYDLPGGTFEDITSTGNYCKSFYRFGTFLRGSYVITGGAVTFSLEFVGKT